jgi:hypothetical protein
MTRAKKTAKRRNKKITLNLKTKTNKTKATRPKQYIIIDFPHTGETITSDYYAFRIGASPCDRVEICLNGKDWLPCRNSIGYWWFDWFNYSPGTYRLKARQVNFKNKLEVSTPVRFKVKTRRK